MEASVGAGSAFGLRLDQLPVRIARAGVAGEGPDVANLDDGLRITVDHLTGGRRHRGNELRDDAHGDQDLAVLGLGRDKLGVVDADKGGFHFSLRDSRSVIADSKPE